MEALYEEADGRIIVRMQVGSYAVNVAVDKDAKKFWGMQTWPWRNEIYPLGGKGREIIEEVLTSDEWNAVVVPFLQRRDRYRDDLADIQDTLKLLNNATNHYEWKEGR